LTIPNGWEFETLCPKVAIDVAVNAANWATGINGLFVMDINLEYTGAWWDPATVAQLLNRVVVEPPATWYRTGGT
jgi:hypothetical protein